MAALVFYLVLALFISFLCSIMEAVLLSTPLSFLKAMEKTRGDRIRRITALKQHIDRPLAAILSLNTIAHTIGAAGVGAQVARVFGEVYFGIASAILTVLILILSEIIPKTIGARFWRTLILPFGNLIRFTIVITYPFVLLSFFITKLFSKKGEGLTISREEISSMAHIGAEEGILQPSENKIIQNLIRLKKIRAEEIMTPRVVVAIASENMKLDEFLKNKEYVHFSRIPVYGNNIEDITGYIFRQDVFEKLTEKEEKLRLKDIKRNIVIIPNSKPVFSVWETLLQKKEHIALIIDEYGGMDGIVTLEDIIETLLGIEIIDEKDTVIDMKQYALERWKKRQAKYKLLD